MTLETLLLALPRNHVLPAVEIFMHRTLQDTLAAESIAGTVLGDNLKFSDWSMQ